MTFRNSNSLISNSRFVLKNTKALYAKACRAFFYLIKTSHCEGCSERREHNPRPSAWSIWDVNFGRLLRRSTFYPNSIHSYLLAMTGKNEVYTNHPGLHRPELHLHQRDHRHRGYHPNRRHLHHHPRWEPPLF